MEQFQTGNSPPWREHDRLAELARYRLVDTPREAALDELTRSAAQLLGVSMAAISLVEDKRQWFKSEYGIGVQETSISDSICKVTIRQEDHLVVPDTILDPRFADNTLVHGAMGLRFYAGEKLVTKNGLPLGALCVLDNKPHPEGLTKEQTGFLKMLAHQVMAQFELQRAIHEQKALLEVQANTEAELRAERDRSQRLLAGMDEGFVLLDRNFIVRQINAGGLKLESRPASEIIGRSHWEAWPNSEESIVGHAYKRAMAEQITINLEHRYTFSDGRCLWLDVRAYPAEDSLAIFYRDITKRKETEEALQQSQARAVEAAKEAKAERRKLDAVLNAVPVGINVADRNGRLIRTNQESRRIWGENQPASRNVDEYAEWKGWWADGSRRNGQRIQAHEWAMTRALLHGETVRHVVEIEPFGQSEVRRILLNSAAPIIDDKDRTAGAVVASMDITELRRSQENLRVMGERLKLVMEGEGEGIWDWNLNDHTFILSGGLASAVGYCEAQVIRHAIEWLSLIHGEDLERVKTMFQDTIRGATESFACEYRIRAKDDRWIWVRSQGVIVERDQGGKPRVMTGTLTDITASKEANDMAWRHANVDGLTNLPNRRQFLEHLQAECRKAKRSERQVALLFLDLDGFKHVNDLFGHEAGDHLLQQTAQRLRAAVRETDTVARLGGDEFAIILASLVDASHIELVCQKILAVLSEPYPLGGNTGFVSGSIGIALYPADSDEAEQLIRKADQAMYAAKRQGKNTFRYFSREMDEKAHWRLNIMTALRHALNDNQLSVLYQPIVDLDSRRIVKAEALVRWHHPSLGQVGPTDFIPLAEESGMIGRIGNWVFRQAAECSKRCGVTLGQGFQISVNKSPIQFNSQDADSNWLQHLSDIGMSGSSISVEITEGVLLHASDKIASQLSAYRDAGIEVLLDDFGTGYSSLSYLQKFKIDYVKIDQSFVQSISQDEGSRAIAEATIMMAHKLGKKVIAEGIETAEQLACLIAAGCDYGQGFLFSCPVTESDLLKQLAAQPR